MVLPEKSVFYGSMQLWRTLVKGEQKFQGGVLTIGNFDGLHLGHQTLLKKMGGFAGPKVVITFDPHPVQVLKPERALKRLFPREDLQEQLPHYGIDLLLILKFDLNFAHQVPENFLNRYVGEPFQPKQIVTGYDFAFGSGRSGNLDLLRSWAASHEIGVDVMPPLECAGSAVSSRRIRGLVLEGDVKQVAVLLGRPFYLRGMVGTGAGRGAGIGFPTINQKVENETLPKGGVYATRTRCEGKSFASVTNIGTNPTFESGTGIKVETHVLDQIVNWRGKPIDVELIERIRDEKKFSGVEDLKKQIQADILKARMILAK